MVDLLKTVTAHVAKLSAVLNPHRPTHEGPLTMIAYIDQNLNKS